MTLRSPLKTTAHSRFGSSLPVPPSAQDSNSRVSSLVWCRSGSIGMPSGLLFSSSIDGSVSEWDLFDLKQKDYDRTVEFVRSHFLVKEGICIGGQGNSNPTLSINKIDKSAGRWKWADILVFNTGHWWTHGKTVRGVLRIQS